MTHTLPLFRALDVFADHLPEIKDACTENILYNISQIEPIPERDGLEGELWDEVYKLEVKRAVGQKKKIIDRITSRQQHTGVKTLGRITDADIQAARETPMEEVFDGELKQSGNRLWARCPFHHERTSSFCIHKDNGWSCFGECSTHGDVIDYVMKRDGVGFVEAVKALVRRR